MSQPKDMASAKHETAAVMRYIFSVPKDYIKSDKPYIEKVHSLPNYTPNPATAVRSSYGSGIDYLVLGKSPVQYSGQSQGYKPDSKVYKINPPEIGQYTQ